MTTRIALPYQQIHTSLPTTAVPTMRQRLETLVNCLDFDCQPFTVKRFATWLGDRRGRKFFFFGIPMPTAWHGAWLTDGEFPHEYIFYNSSLSLPDQERVQLHEIGHYLCGHTTLKVTGELLHTLLHAQPLLVSLWQQALVRSLQPGNTKEMEAEMVAEMLMAKGATYENII